ncbi:MAG: (d)CMP kinase [Clostridia bacterium]|nr:(d)CMP kinase [Clostridia bacterium]
MNIAIDGPSGAGKSSLAKGLAKYFGMIYVDTGALYRAVGLYAKRKGIPVDDVTPVEADLDTLRVGLCYKDREQHVLLFDEDVTALIRTPEISMYASAVSARPAVRAFLLETQRRMAREHSVVMDGRDIGTVILPQAEVKIFLIASDLVRAKRRKAELESKGICATVEEVLADMQKRDRNDRERETAPAVPAADAILLDNSDLTEAETIEAAIAVVKEKMKI